MAIIFGLAIWGLSKLLPTYSSGSDFRLIAALMLLATAAVVDIRALLSFRKRKTTIDPRYPHKTSSIVTGGIYTRTRNPMYLGLVLILSAASIYFAARFGFFIIAAFILYMNAFQIKPEEEVLEKQFGEEYLSYKARVRRWI